MTNKQIQALLRKVNNGKFKETIFLRPLSSTVDFAFVWINTPGPKQNRVAFDEFPYKFYLIKNTEGIYVGAVLDIIHDLHWYLNNKFRKQGIMTHALKDVILPHLFQDRAIQRITISQTGLSNKEASNSEKLALKVGFKFIKNEIVIDSKGKEVILEKKFIIKIKGKKTITGINVPITEERLDVLLKRVNYLAKSLSFIRYEFEAAYNESSNTELIVKELKKTILKLEDIWWKYNKDNE